MKRNYGTTIRTITELSRAFPVATILQVISFLFLVISAFMAYKLAPLVQNIDLVARRVDAISDSLKDRPELIQRFVVTEQKVNDFRDALDKIDKRETRIEDKIDRLIELK